jgi:anaerobic dimethyl sulfoxide reductase subunit C (anchor subunit)
MIENFVTLLFFTFIGQTAIGMILVREVLVFEGSLLRHGKIGKKSQYVITFLLIISLFIAFMHLHNPLRAVYALNNVASSPLSMEIGSLSALLVTSISLSYLTYRDISTRFSGLLSSMSVLFAAVFLVTMIMVYYLPSVPAWNSPATPTSFIFTAVSSGAMLIALMFGRENRTAAIRLTGIAVLITTALSLVTFLSSSGHVNSLITIPIIQSIAAFLALVLYVISFSGSFMNKMHQMIVIISVLIILSGILARLYFFLSFDNNIL